MPRPLTPEDLYAITLASDAQIAPDGSRVAYVVTTINRETYEYQRTIWMARVEGGAAPVAFTHGPADTAPRWSPDGRQLAFVRAPGGKVQPSTEEERTRGHGKPQIWIVPTDGGEARQLTVARDGASDPVWSPDSASLVYTAPVGEPDDAEAEDAALSHKDVPHVRTLDRIWFRGDGGGWNYERRAHLFRIPAGGGEATQLTDGDWDDGAPAWSPDGTRLAFTSDRTEERWTWPGSDIWVLNLATGNLTRLTDGTVECGAPAWSPDGRQVAFTSAPRRGSGGHADLYVAPADGGAAPRLLTEDFVPTCGDTCVDDQRAGHGPARLFWSLDGQRIYTLASFRGTVHVYAAPVEGGTPGPVTRGERHVVNFTLDAARRTLAAVCSDPLVPGDVYVERLDASGRASSEGPRRLTELNRDLFAEVELAPVASYAFQGADGWELQGWVMRPKGAAPETRLPAVLEIHGGPSAMYGDSFFLEFQLLAAQGYAVVYTNPRGSTGYGRQFSAAVMDDWGGNDYADLMAGLDAAIARGGIDPERLAVAGGSYGGYMTNWVVGHTDRFKAAVTMRCLSNWASFYGTSDIGWFFTEEQVGATPWTDLERLMRHSPITYVANIHTPLLILHGEEDLRCPISEGEQLFVALKRLGREARLVRFEGQSHDLSRGGHPRSRVLRFQHILGWIGEHVPAARGAS